MSVMEAVSDYPRPPRLEVFSKSVRIEFAGKVIAKTTKAIRVLEKNRPPVYYIPREDIRSEFIHPAAGLTFCEWKGAASYWSIVVGSKRVKKAAWGYENPTTTYAPIRSHLAFYANLMGACFVDGEKVNVQAGNSYGGWITLNLLGPFQ